MIAMTDPRKRSRLGRRDSSSWVNISYQAEQVLKHLVAKHLISNVSEARPFGLKPGEVKRLQYSLTIRDRVHHLNLYQGTQTVLGAKVAYLIELLVSPKVKHDELLREITGAIKMVTTGLDAEDQFIRLANEYLESTSIPERLIHATLAQDFKGVDMYFGQPDDPQKVPIQFTVSEKSWISRRHLKLPLIYIPYSMLQKVDGQTIVRVLQHISRSYFGREYSEHIDFRRLPRLAVDE
jgi:hypothetical protein